MEKQFFDYEYYESYDDGLRLFYDCTLKVDLGQFLIGDKLDEITIDFKSGVMELYYKGQLASTHNLVLALV